VRVTSKDFAEQLARSRGLIASPSRGVVTQAVALGKPVYLFCPKGHIEQEYNLRFYMQRFVGIASPKGRRYRRYFSAKRHGRGRNATVTLPDGYSGKLQTLLEWEASLSGLDLAEQASTLRDWLGKTDERIRSRLIPLLSPTAEELAAEAAEAALEADEEARERAEAAAEAASPEVEDDGDGDEEEEDDDDPEEDSEQASGPDEAGEGADGGSSASAANQ